MHEDLKNEDEVIEPVNESAEKEVEVNAPPADEKTKDAVNESEQNIVELVSVEFQKNELPPAVLRKAKKIEGALLESSDEFTVITIPVDAETALVEAIGETKDLDIRTVKAGAGRSLFRVLHESGFDESSISALKIIFESAVNEKISDKMTRIDEEIAAGVEARLDEIHNSIETMMTEAAADWIKKNQVAIGDNVRFRNAERFYRRVMEAFADAGIDVNPDTADVLSQMNESLDEKKSEVDGLRAKLDAANAKIREHVINESIANVVFEKNLSDIQAERLRDLLESVETDKIPDHITVITETFFSAPKARTKIDDDVVEKPLTESFIIKEETKSKQDPVSAVLSRMNRLV